MQKKKKKKERTAICSSLYSDNNHEFGEAKEVKDVGKVMLSPGSSYGQSL